MPATNANHSLLRAEALRRLENELDNMVKTGYINIPPTHHFKLDEDGLPKVTPRPIPQVSSERLSQIKSYIKENLQHQSTHWKHTVDWLDNLETSPSHQELWTAIRECHHRTMEDYTWLDHVLRTLELQPSRLLLFDIKDNLAPCIGRIVGTCDETSNSEDIASNEVKKLINQHHGLYVLISAIHTYYDKAVNNNVLKQRELRGTRVAQCLRVLVNAVSHANPAHNLDAEVFLSLKNSTYSQSCMGIQWNLLSPIKVKAMLTKLSQKRPMQQIFVGMAIRTGDQLYPAVVHINIEAREYQSG